MHEGGECPLDMLDSFNLDGTPKKDCLTCRFDQHFDREAHNANWDERCRICEFGKCNRWERRAIA